MSIYALSEHWEAVLTLIVVGGLLVALVREWASQDLLFGGAVLILVFAAEVMKTNRLPSASLAVSGMGNTGVITIAALFVLVTGLSTTGAMNLVASFLLGRPKSAVAAQLRIMSPVVLLSAFLNNTPVVAMFLPVIEDICKRARISPSKLYLPMAYAATLGGMCTLIGTSTNLLVNERFEKYLAERSAVAEPSVAIPDTPTGVVPPAGGAEAVDSVRPLQPLRLFDLAWVGVPCAVAGMFILIVGGRWLLPERKAAIALHDDPRQYTVEMIVQANGPLVGKSIEQAGLRHLPGLYLVEIERNGEVLAAVSPREKLSGDDRLVFVGVIDSVVDLQNIRGLTRAGDPAFQLETPHSRRQLIEAVVSDRCPLIGSTIREGRFRTVYNAAVVAVARGGRRIPGKVGDIVLRPGDTMLLEADHEFLPRQRNSSHFFLISGLENSLLMRHDRAWIALAILAALIGSVTLEWVPLLAAAMAAAAAMIVTQCCSVMQARQSVDWSLLAVIAAALGIGEAIRLSGLAEILGNVVFDLAGDNEWLTLVAVYAFTMLLTELITNNAAAILSFPIAMAAAEKLEAHPMAFVVAVAIAASGGFATPFGYQTNLMVYGPGGYRYSDYLRIGIPLDLACLAVTVAVAPLVWPFH